ncbi:Uncharacterized protein APZ42_006865, partial [Daphnia magna]
TKSTAAYIFLSFPMSWDLEKLYNFFPTFSDLLILQRLQSRQLPHTFFIIPDELGLRKSFNFFPLFPIFLISSTASITSTAAYIFHHSDVV